MPPVRSLLLAILCGLGRLVLYALFVLLDLLPTDMCGSARPTRAKSPCP